MDIKSNLTHNFDQARNSLELNGLNSIRQQSREGSEEAKDGALKEAAQQFEAIFMKMLLSSMRKAQDVLESDSPFNSQSTKFYRDMHDQQMAVELSSNGSLGLTDLIVRQLGGDSGNFKPSSVLRNDGNLAATDDVSLNHVSLNHVNNTDDTTGKTSAGKRNTLIENMLARSNQLNEQIQPEIDIPFAGNYNGNNYAQSAVMGQFNQKTVNKSSRSESVNSLTPDTGTTFNEPKDFVSALTEPAKKVQQQLGVPFEVVIAQAALETGWGQKIIKQSDGTSSNNLFNIKADNRWGGDKVTKDTLEFEQGAMVKKSEPFRTYSSMHDSVNDYINFLSNSDRYQDALQNSGNVEHFLHGLQKAGYATDPQYANKILGTLKKVTNLLAK
ncbi:flagellar assembly peptidoglycan hydrolase FlgJ [Colwellia asteriadis]|uniref:Peptidoglycan hydrolase FlgJ n=1 Tax=Colwellia asteriadis TaxID=517723 RepID=A0ABN1L5R1_9GAMM